MIAKGPALAHWQSLSDADLARHAGYAARKEGFRHISTVKRR
jgi:hypothetical protein